ncbi:MAG TPA: helix-turn-helix transcriptional regulator [Tissierellaceae bacterium]
MIIMGISTITIFNKRLRSLREQHKISQKDFAEILGVSNVVLSRYENGERKPDYDMLIKIAEHFDVSVDYLLGKSNSVQLSDEEEFQNFIEDPELEMWYKQLPNNKEDDLRALKDMWEIIKRNQNNK